MIWSRHLLAELRRGGMRHVCICPGKRSLPLTLAALADPQLQTSSHVDERSAGFFALGLAKATGQPVGIITTSGTAGAHLYPAVIEADLGRVPLIVMTADRPPRLHDCGAPQTIDQQRLFGDAVRSFVDPGLPGDPRLIRRVAARAVARACGLPAGPVHLNLPFDEPLTCDELPPIDEIDSDQPWIEHAACLPEMTAATLERVSALVHQHRRGMIVCGPLDPQSGLAAAVRSLAWRSGYPVLADCLSQLRFDPQCERDILGGYDAFLRVPGLADALAPTLIIRFGAAPTSKSLNQAIVAWDAQQILVDPAGEYRSPEHNRTLLVQCDERAFCRGLAETMIKPLQPDLRFRGMLDRAEQQVWSVARTMLQEEWFEGALTATTLSAIPPEGTLWVASSKPVREIDTFCRPGQRPLRVLASRGANGIDGMLSQALGAAWAGRGKAPVVLLCGDLAFLHDIGGLLAARRLDLDLTIVVVNDDGGRIFDFLDLRGFGEQYDPFVATRHGMQFEQAAALYGLDYRRVDNAAELTEAIAGSIEQGGTRIIEAPLCPEHNLQIHKAFHRAVSSGAHTDTDPQKGPRSDANDNNREESRPVVQREHV